LGRLKDRLIEEEERGWYSVSRQMVCDSCVSDSALRKLIRDNGSETRCEYCSSTPEETDLRCIPFDDLMDVIGERVNSEFTGADDEGIPWDGEEDQYAFAANVFDTYDLINDVIGLDANESVLDDIVRALPDQSWCRREFFSLSLSEALGSGWNDFVNKVKYETRYLFTLPLPSAPRAADQQVEADISFSEQDDGISIGDSKFGVVNASEDDLASYNVDYPISMGDPEFGVDYDREEGIPAYAMLDAIGNIVRRLNIVRVIEPGTSLYRVRVHEANELFSTPDELGPPSREDAKQPNRMSPAGIVMFYGALEKDTAIAETFQTDRDGAAAKLVTVAQFEQTLYLRIEGSHSRTSELHPSQMTCGGVCSEN
jgi:HEPN/RES N-terminal domain 1/RES domain